LQAAVGKLEKERAEHNKNMQLKNDERKKTKAELEKRNQEFAKLQADKTKAFEEALAATKARDDEIEKLKQQIATLTDTNAKVVQNSQAKEKDLVTALNKIKEKIEPVDRDKFDLPKGKILSIDRTGTTTYVDLGSGDRVKPGLTFSIFTPGLDGKRNSKEPKGSLEIVSLDTRDKHLSLARITETRSPTRDPIQKNDLIYNPAWTPNMRQHVVIAGL